MDVQKIIKDGVMRDMTEEEMEEMKWDSSKIKARDVRRQRDVLLKGTDWTQVADAPVDQAVWAAYRQALRDIPQQEGFPDNVVWPVEP